MTINSRRLISRRVAAGLTIGASLLGPSLARVVAPKRLQLHSPDGRSIEVWHWPAQGWQRGTIAFSHGAQSAPWKYDALLGPWIAAGWRVFAPLHVDSTDHPLTARFAGPLSWPARIEDMRAVSTHIGGPYVAAGHSYGGLTALTLGGATAKVPEGVSGPLRDLKARAVVAFSPPAPIPGFIEAAGYATLAVPALIQTGTGDVPPGATSWRVHLAAYDAAANGGDRYALVLDDVDHFFGGAICKPELPGPKQTAEIEAAAKLALQFINGFGAGQQSARRALDARLSASGAVHLQRK